MSNSMINPSIVNLLEKVDDRYSLVTITSKRSRQLIDGAKPLVDIDSTKPVTVAINEIHE
ncbi:DNA-directed RNA polymerase subunit omega [Clostridium botulinum]|nr:DNA-directed RNA polymerase subunit omega [Clostridium botulinum]AXG93886.1 DNA-directed RNA polymerase subunit omega [Clostridium botulinum]